MIRRSLIALTTAAACLGAVFGATASGSPAKAPLGRQADSASPAPQVICAITYGPIGQAKFAYRTRPHACLFHKPGTPVDEADLVAGSQLQWTSWTRSVAVGRGKSAENMVGLIPMDVKLIRPQTVCGHTVFSKAQFRFPTSSSSYGRPVALDRSIGSC
ncbi:MAG: hypothetical protein WB507_04020 [Solirubrobacterales bacterium]